MESVRSILDVPLVNSPRVSLTELKGGEGIRTLETPGTDRELARQELQESPIYRNNLISADGRTTALLVLFKEDATYNALLNKRDRLREKELESGLTSEEAETPANGRADLSRVSRRDDRGGKQGYRSRPRHPGQVS